MIPKHFERCLKSWKAEDDDSIDEIGQNTQ